MKALRFRGENGQEVVEEEIPEAMKEIANEWRSKW